MIGTLADGIPNSRAHGHMFKSGSSTIRGPQRSGASSAPPEDDTMTRQTARHPVHATLPGAWANGCGTVPRSPLYGEASLVRPGRRWMTTRGDAIVWNPAGS